MGKLVRFTHIVRIQVDDIFARSGGILDYVNYAWNSHHGNPYRSQGASILDAARLHSSLADYPPG